MRGLNHRVDLRPDDGKGLPGVAEFGLAASAETDLPAAPKSSTSSCRTTLLALACTGCLSSTATSGSAGSCWLASTLLGATGSTVGRKSTSTLLSPLKEFIPPIAEARVHLLNLEIAAVEGYRAEKPFLLRREPCARRRYRFTARVGTEMDGSALPYVTVTLDMPPLPPCRSKDSVYWVAIQCA